MIPFHIVALVYIIVSGSPIDEPARVNHNMIFKNLTECQSFMQGPAFQMQRAALYQMFRDALPKPEPADADSVAGLPDIAITASCEEDTSL